jgi:hypothetical protein
VNVQDPSVSVNPRGAIFGVWTQTDGPRTVVEDDAGAGGPQTVSSGGDDASAPVVASDGLANGASIFIQGGRAFVAGFDGAPPSLDSVSVPPITPAAGRSAWPRRRSTRGRRRA